MTKALQRNRASYFFLQNCKNAREASINTEKGKEFWQAEEEKGKLRKKLAFSGRDQGNWYKSFKHLSYLFICL